MEFAENNNIEEPEEEGVEIYSKKAIWWFSVIPMPLFGGILLAINLWNAGYKQAVYTVVAFALLYNIAIEFLVSWLMAYYKIIIPLNYKMDNNVLNEKIFALSGASVALNVIGGAILSQYFFKKYFPDDDYYPKSVSGPLIIVVMLMIFSLTRGI